MPPGNSCHINLQLLVNIFKYIIDSNLRHSVTVYWTVLKSHLYVWWVHNFKEKIMYPRLACYKICCCVIAWSAHWEEVRLGLFLLCENKDGGAFRTISVYWDYARCWYSLALSLECFGHFFFVIGWGIYLEKKSQGIPWSNIKL